MRILSYIYILNCSQYEINTKPFLMYVSKTEFTNLKFKIMRPVSQLIKTTAFENYSKL